MTKNIDTILNSVFYIPLLLEENEEFLHELELTPKERNHLNMLKPFLEYNLQFIREGKGDYDKLRQGLTAYFDLYLSHIFQKLGYIDKKWKFLDFAAGSMVYSKRFKIDNPESSVLTLDREGCDINIDFEKEPYWNQKWPQHFDCVLLSEILHCKGHEGQKDIINSVAYTLKKGGKLLINENDDVFMHFRLKSVTEKGAKMSIEEVVHLMTFFKTTFKLKRILNINRHNIYEYEKL